MRIETFIGLRFLRSPRRDKVVSVLTWISTLGVMLGVTALVVTISVMNGFRQNLFIAVTGTQGHLNVQPEQGALAPAERARLERLLGTRPEVEASAPYFAHQVFLSVKGDYRAALLRGIDPEAELRATELWRFLRASTVPAERPDPERQLQARAVLARLAPGAAESGRAGIVLGASLARALGLVVGDEVQVTSTVQRLTPIGPVPLMKRFEVVGLVETGIGGSDDLLAYVELRLAQRLFRLGEDVDGLSVRLRDPQRIGPEPWRTLLPGYRIGLWSESNRNVFQVMRLEKLGIFLVLTLIIVVAFFNIVSSLIMMVVEKRKAIAILKALGASDGVMRRVFFAEGFAIGAIGTFTGLALGLAACWLLATFDIVRLPPGVYPLSSRLPVLLQWQDLLLITASSFLICLLVTLYPATRAARERPIEGLRSV
ncbi:MAG: ABC transporter permease [Candidatus Lambdaproteobacteria bacterium]|nr:ABC transporter permease [Candidatus Lambdaproteobacteria bacterium]